jgi:hypothetical protein
MIGSTVQTCRHSGYHEKREPMQDVLICRRAIGSMYVLAASELSRETIPHVRCTSICRRAIVSMYVFAAFGLS